MLELKHISKIFPGVKALDDVSLTFKPGEIHALMGEKRSGKIYAYEDHYRNLSPGSGRNISGWTESGG